MGLFLVAPAGLARADYLVKEEARTVLAVDDGSHAPIFDALGRPMKFTTHVKYVVLTHDDLMLPGQQVNTLLICLHGAGDSASNFIGMWITLMARHTKLVVAAPEINLLAWTDQQIAAVVADTVAKDHVNPKHVILVGHSMGAGQAVVVIGEHPRLYAGFASLSGCGVWRFLTPGIRKYGASLALYENDGTGEGVKAQNLAFEASTLRYYGFKYVLMETSPRGHNMEYLTFAPDTLRMMAFFDAALASMDQQAAMKKLAAMKKPAAVISPPCPAAASSPPPNVVVEQRTLANPAAGYVLLTPDRTKVSAPHDSTLLICLHGPGDTGMDFAKNWFALVGSRSDVVVAILSEGSKLIEASGNEYIELAGPVIKEIIADTVARDHVNPRRVILVGHDLGGRAAFAALRTNRGLFAGFAGISMSLQGTLDGHNRKPYEKIPVYYAVGTKDEMFDEVFNYSVKLFKEGGYSQLLAESPATGHALTQDEIKHMMDFFDKELALSDQSATPADVVAQ